MAAGNNENAFSRELISFIEAWRNKPGNLIMVLHRVQEEFGYVSRESADTVAYMLDIPLAKIYGVLSFYHFFKTTKTGRPQYSGVSGNCVLPQRRRYAG